MSAAPSITWSELYAEAELYKAAVRLYTKPLFAPRKALSTSTDSLTLFDFARNGLSNLSRIHHKLDTKRFSYGLGQAVHHRFNGRRRTLFIYPWTERLIDLLLYRMLNKALEEWFAPCSYAYREGGIGGVDRCQRRVARALRRSTSPTYVVKRDISGFFGSVNHATLRRALGDLIPPDDYLHQLLEQRISFRYRDGGEICRADRGIPFGTAIACAFANILLTPLDRALLAIPETHVFRYADDILILSQNRESAEAARLVLNETFRKLKLKSKPSHEVDLILGCEPATDDDPLFQSASHFRYLGLEFDVTGEIRLSRDKARRIRNRFRYAFRRRAGSFRRIKDPVKRAQLAIDLSRDVIEHGFRNVAIIDYYLRHTQNELQFREIDRWLAEEVLSIAFGGHRKGHFRKLTFSELRRMGLPSLVHRRRQILHRHLESSFFVWKNRRRSHGSGDRRPGLQSR